MRNRSVPTDTLLSHIVYRDLPRAISWLTALGFEEHYRYGDPISGAQMRFGDACLMLKAARTALPDEAARSHYLTVIVEDVDAHFQKAKAVDAKIVEEVHETCYGERQYAIEDFEGHCWLFSQHVRDLSPDEWGAILARA